MKGFNRFLLHFRKDATHWLFFMLYLSVFRVVFILFFREELERTTSTADILATALNGLRYDSMVSTWWLLVSVLAGVAAGFTGARIGQFADRVRSATGFLFLLCTAIAWCFTFVYFKEYHEQFNHFIFNLYYDDTKAILLTIWADYHPIPVVLTIGAVTALALLLLKRFLRLGSSLDGKLSARRDTFVARLAIALALLVLVVVAARGSVGRRPAQRKDASITRDAFLNKAVVNPWNSLLFALQDHAQQTGLSGLAAFLPDGDVRRAAREWFRDPRSLADLDAYFRKRAKGPKTEGGPPRHIFLVVMESYDAWPLLDKYSSLGLTPTLSRLAKSGLSFERFLPASDGTMQSLTSIMTGLPYARVEINYQLTARRPYPSSIAETFKRMGYRTRFFYGGYLSWQRIGAFASDQGIEEIYGAPHMDAGATTHEWGVDDEYLLAFAAATVGDDRPSFNIIMTTSYHPPYNVDVWGKGFPLREVPADLAPQFDDAARLKMLGHLWYSDKCLGDFVKNVEGKLPRALFAFTGDHFGRKFINARPDFFERSAVPFILYGKGLLEEVLVPEGAAGGHIDIGPTLVELAARKGFEYYSVGQDLLAPRTDFLGVGFFRGIGGDYLLELSDPPAFHPLPGNALPKTLPDAGVVRKALDQAYGLGWWRVRRGAEF